MILLMLVTVLSIMALFKIPSLCHNDYFEYVAENKLINL